MNPPKLPKLPKPGDTVSVRTQSAWRNARVVAVRSGNVEARFLSPLKGPVWLPLDMQGISWR